MMTIELLESIDRLVEAKTFNLDALEAIKDLRTKTQSLVDENESQSNLINRQQEEIERLNRTVRDQSNKLETLMDKSLEVAKREKDAEKAIYEAERHKAVADTFRECMGIVFKPNVVRETIQRNVPVPLNGSGGCAGFVSTGSESGFIEREEG